MTNTTLLRQKIDESGYKLQFLAEMRFDLLWIDEKSQQ